MSHWKHSFFCVWVSQQPGLISVQSIFPFASPMQAHWKHLNWNPFSKCKRGCVIPMVIWPVFRMGQYIVNDLPYHAPQFIFEPRLKINDCNIYDRAKSIYFKYILFHINLFDNEVLFISPVNTINNFKLLKIIN